MILSDFRLQGVFSRGRNYCFARETTRAQSFQDSIDIKALLIGSSEVLIVFRVGRYCLGLGLNLARPF